MKILGLMSGTSLDGLDLALCHFTPKDNGYTYQIIHAETIAYSASLQKQLAEAHLLNAEQFFHLNAIYGNFLAEACNSFLKQHNQTADAIASHGHTVFHRPALGFSTQIGAGATIAATTGITTVCDFRSTDVALHGQGAPLVPIGDALLFSHYAACLNIGGIANISFTKDDKRVAFDVCEANMALNYLAAKLNLPYDRDGAIAAAHKVDQQLRQQLNSLPFYRQSGAKSIGREWFEQMVQPLLDASNLSTGDLLSTVSMHVADIIAECINKHACKNVLVTGGGAFNNFLIDNIREKSRSEIIVPDKNIVNFKEALVFAFLGYLRLNNKINSLASVTGATHNSIGGAVYLGSRL